MSEPPLRNRTVLAVAEVVAGCFDFNVNIGGRFEPRTRTDLLGDFLYAYEFPQALVAYARTLQPQPGVIKAFVLGLDIRGGQASPLGVLLRSWDEAASVSQPLLRKVAQDIVTFTKSGDALVRPAAYQLQRLTDLLELDGYEFRGERLAVREENVFDVVQETGEIERLFIQLGLDESDQVAADLKQTDELYTTAKWGDAIKHARDVLEVALRSVARAQSKVLSKNLSKSAMPGPVRAFLKDNSVIDETEKEFLYALHGLLSVQGGHPNMSDRAHARICRQYALTAAHFILIRWESIKK